MITRTVFNTQQMNLHTTPVDLACAEVSKILPEVGGSGLNSTGPLERELSWVHGHYELDHNGHYENFGRSQVLLDACTR